MKERPLFRLLVVDDVRGNRRQYADIVLNQASSKEESNSKRPPRFRTEVAVAASPADALNILNEARASGNPFHVVVTDLCMPEGKDGTDFIRSLGDHNFTPDSLDIFLVSRKDDSDVLRQDVEYAKNLWVKNGISCLTPILRADTPTDENEFLDTVWAALWERIDENLRNHHRFAEVADFNRQFLTKNSVLKNEIERILNIASSSNIPILITGETGTGKEILAREIHSKSGRSRERFVPVNAASIPETLFESEMFGHEKGAFTGAANTREGKIKYADNGTFFLDEIGELPLHVQAKFLRVLQERKIERVGRDDLLPVNIRLVSATKRNLKEMVKAGTFRDDLFFRINQQSIHIPPLRERREDIGHQALAFWFQDQPDSGVGPRYSSWDSAAISLLTGYSWPGNSRELYNVVASIKAETMHVSDQDVTADIVVRALKITEKSTLYPGLDQSTNLAFRTAHILFYPAMMAALEGVHEKANDTQIINIVCHEVARNYFIYFANSFSEALKTIRKNFENHRAACPTCGKMWKNTFNP